MTRRENARPGAWQHGGRARSASGATASSSARIALPCVMYNNRGAVVGSITSDPDGAVWLEKFGLDPAVHKLRKPEGWATDTAHIDALLEVGGVGVRLYLVNGT